MIVWIQLAFIIVVGLVVSIMLAMAGEPQSVWLWRDVFGVI